MTTIAVFRIHTVPVIIGDVLFSTEGDAGYSITLPGSGEKSDELAESRDLDYHPAELKQKVTIINNNLIVACAGDQGTAISFIHHLREDEKLNSEPTFEHFSNVLESFEYDDEISFAFVYIYIDKEKCATGGGGLAERVEHPDFDGLVVAGSGSVAIVEALTNTETNYTHENIPDGLKAPHRVNQILSRLWSLDITNQKSIEKGFGGGYEIGTIGDDKVTRKIGDILFAAVEAHNAPGGVMIGMNSRFTKFDYQDENLIVRVMELQRPRGSERAKGTKDNPIDEGEELPIADVAWRGTIVPPLATELEDVVIDHEELAKLPDFNATYLSVHASVKADNGKHLSAVFSEWRPLRNCSIEFSDKKVFFTPPLWKSILEHVHEFIAANKEKKLSDNKLMGDAVKNALGLRK